MIKIDMEMPTCCDECWALDDNGDYPSCLITKETRGYNFRTREKRMDHCPLIPSRKRYYKTYVVSYVVGNDIEPVITVFDNKESAQKMYDYMKDAVSHIWLDECLLHSKYITRW